MEEQVFSAPKPQRGFLGGGNRDQRDRRGSRRTYVTGGDKETNFAAPIDIFVANVNRGVEGDTIKEHLRTKKGLEILNIERISHKEARNWSYRVSVNFLDQEKALSSEIWPQGVRVRIFRHNRYKPDKNGEGNREGNQNQFQ